MSAFKPGDYVRILVKKADGSPAPGSIGIVKEPFLNRAGETLVSPNGRGNGWYYLEGEIERVDLATPNAPRRSDAELLTELVTRLSVGIEKAAGNPALQLVVEGLAIGFIADQSPEAKAVVRVLVEGVDE